VVYSLEAGLDMDLFNLRDVEEKEDVARKSGISSLLISESVK
jgi:hypothetical protein